MFQANVVESTLTTDYAILNGVIGPLVRTSVTAVSLRRLPRFRASPLHRSIPTPRKATVVFENWMLPHPNLTNPTQDKHSHIAMAVSVLLAMYCRGLYGSCLGSVNTHGTGMYAALAGAASRAKQANTELGQVLAMDDKFRLGLVYDVS